MLSFLEAAVHTILYTRAVYPPELFEAVSHPKLAPD
jgi:hypothetical protein